jgi:hypothetical protein
MDTCIKFLMLSETTQKRLTGAPQPPRPCAVKELVCQRLQLLLAEKNKRKPPPPQQHGTATVGAAATTTVSLTNAPFIDTLNLLLMIIRHAFPSYPKAIPPMAGFTAASKLNRDVKSLHQQMLDIVAWMVSKKQ